jgi:hypothetical protein
MLSLKPTDWIGGIGRYRWLRSSSHSNSIVLGFLVVISLWLASYSLVSGQFQFNTIDSIYQIDSKTFRYTLNCGVNNSVAFQGKAVGTDTLVDAEIRCGFPVYYYQLNLAGYIPIETASVEVGNCIQQYVPDVFLEITPDSSGSAAKRSASENSLNKREFCESTPADFVDLDAAAVAIGDDGDDGDAAASDGPDAASRRRDKRDFACGVMNKIPVLNILTTGNCPTAATVNELDRIFSRSGKITEQAKLLADNAQQISSNIQQTNQLLQQCNEKTNAAFQNVQGFVKDQMNQMYDQTNQKMQFASDQLNNVIRDQSARVSALINATNQQLAQTDFAYIQNQIAQTYRKMLNMSEEQMQTEYGFLNDLLNSMDDLKYKERSSSQSLDDFYEVLLQLQYHQLGYGNLARNYHEALQDVQTKGYTTFLKSNGTAPRLNDSFFLIVDTLPDLENKYCGHQLYLISYQSQLHWYIKNPSSGRPLNCDIKFATRSPISMVTIGDEVFSMLPDNEDPTLELRRKTTLLELSTVYGLNQTVWGTTLGEGMTTSRRYALFDGTMYKSKCDTGRFGVYVNQWVPVYRLSFARSYVENASISYSQPDSDEQISVHSIHSAQWLDPNQGTLPKNNDLFIFHRNESHNNQSVTKVFNIYSPPSSMIQLDGPTSTRIGKLGYFSWHTVPSDPVDFYDQWTTKNGPIDPNGMAISLSLYKQWSINPNSFCADFDPNPVGLCALSSLYNIDWNPEAGYLKLIPKEATMQIVTELPLSDPSFNVSQQCPPKTSTGRNATEMFCNNLFCQLTIENEANKVSPLQVLVNHTGPAPCSYDFHINVPPKTIFRDSIMTLTLHLCVGDFVVRVMSGPTECYRGSGQVVNLPSVENGASLIQYAVTTETQHIMDDYSRLLDNLNIQSTYIEYIDRNFSHFMNFRPDLDLDELGFNLRDWSQIVDQLYNYTPITKDYMMGMFNLSLNFTQIEFNQSNLYDLIQQQIAAAQNFSKQAKQYRDSINEFSLFGNLDTTTSAIIIGVVLLAILFAVCFFCCWQSKASGMI